MLGVDGEQAWAELVTHLDACTTCRDKVSSGAAGAALADDVRWAQRVREKISVDVNVPLARLNAVLTDYELIEEIGRGGMGIVFKARHLRLDRLVALKVLPALLGVVRPDSRKRFEREASLAARLEHTNIISVYDFGQVDGTMYYAMQLIEGRSLRDVLREIDETGAIDVVLGGKTSIADSSKPEAVSSKPSAISRHPRTSPQRGSDIPHSSAHPQSAIINPQSSLTRLGSSNHSDRAYFRQMATWIAEAAEALEYAHELGVIHRDIKPSNLLLTTEGRLMIADFGLARAHGAGTMTASRSLLGTVRYMSPEQADEGLGSIDRRTDVYSLGATLYELLTFRPMFAAADDREVLNQVLHKEPTPPHRLVRQVPRELETICLKAVEKEPVNRYTTAKEFADDLRRWLLDMPIHARRASLPTRVQRFVRRRKVSSALAASLVVLLAVTSVLFAGYRSSRREAAEAFLVATDENVRRLSLEARMDLMEGHVDAALAKVVDGLSQQPELLHLQILHAEILHHALRYDEAEQVLKKIVDRDPECWTAHYVLALIYDAQNRAIQDPGFYGPSKSESQASTTELDAQIGFHRRKVEELMSDTAEAYYLRASAEPDPQKVIALLSTALELGPNTIEALVARAWAYMEIGDADAMLLDAERAVAMHPGWSTLHLLRGAALLEASQIGTTAPTAGRMGRLKEAESSYSRAIELAPAAAVSWYQRGLTRCRLAKFNADQRGRLAEAVADLDEALRLDPQFARAYMMRGAARAMMGCFDQAVVDCKRAIEIRPEDTELYFEFAGVLQHAQRWEEMLESSHRIVERLPEDPRGYQARALAYCKLGQYEQAIAEGSRAIEIKPDDPRDYHERAIALLGAGEGDPAIADLTRAIQLDPNRRPYRYQMRAIANFQVQHYDEAASDFTRVLEIEPNRKILLLRRGMSYEMAGTHEQALRDYGRAGGFGGSIGQYAVLWQSLLLRELSSKTEAESILSARGTVDEGNGWLDRLFDLVAGTISPDELRKAAKTEDERAEAYYYIGRRALLDGDPENAEEAFAACIALNRTDVLETEFARALHKRLREEADSSADESPPATRSSSDSRGSRLGSVSQGG